MSVRRGSLEGFDGEIWSFGDMSLGKSLGQCLVLGFMESRSTKFLSRTYSQVMTGAHRVLPNPIGLICKNIP